MRKSESEWMQSTGPKKIEMTPSKLWMELTRAWVDGIIMGVILATTFFFLIYNLTW